MSEKARQSMVVTKENDLHPCFFGEWGAFEHSVLQVGLVGVAARVWVFQDGGSRKDKWRGEIGGQDRRGCIPYSLHRGEHGQLRPPCACPHDRGEQLKWETFTPR